MAILTYESVKEKEKTLQSMTSLTRQEFEELVPYFERAWEQQQKDKGRDPAKGGRKPTLQGAEEQLFFILFYLKTYPLQEVIAHLFDLSQGAANQWIHRFSTVLKKALAQADHLPARLPEEMLARLAEEGDQALGLDGTERRIEALPPSFALGGVSSLQDCASYGRSALSTRHQMHGYAGILVGV